MFGHFKAGFSGISHMYIHPVNTHSHARCSAVQNGGKQPQVIVPLMAIVR